MDLGTLGGNESSAAAINASAQIVGQSSLAGDTESHAFSWTPAGGMEDLGTLGGTFSSAVALNSVGLIAGTASTAGNAEYHAVLWSPTPPAPRPRPDNHRRCLNGGWKSLVDAGGRPFKSQAQCVAYKKN
jgi:probable HAF family extracellular repeat protein